MRISSEEFGQLEMEKEELQDENTKLRKALHEAQHRFTDPKFGCVWLDAAEDIKRVLNE